MDILKEFMPAIKSLSFALIVLVVGLIIIKKVVKRLEARFEKIKMDSTLRPFFVSLSDVLLKLFLALILVKIIGIDTSSFVAVLASAGFAIGLAFQGSLSNFAGGVLLLTQRPFKVGDFIETGEHKGLVKGIKILYTEILTIDNKLVFIPNGGLANSAITNYSAMTSRRVEMKFSVSYESNVEKVKQTIMDVFYAHELVLDDPKPFVRLFEHGASDLVFLARIWTKTDDYWDAYYDIVEGVKEAFDRENISIPYPQMDVHIRNEKR